MAWEHRGKKRYYYRKKREGQQVVSEYKGKGLLAEVCSDFDAEDSAESRVARIEWRKQKLKVNKTETELKHLDETIHNLVRAILLTSGYHPHKGQWRKTRHV